MEKIKRCEVEKKQKKGKKERDRQGKGREEKKGSSDFFVGKDDRF